MPQDQIALQELDIVLSSSKSMYSYYREDFLRRRSIVVHGLQLEEFGDILVIIVEYLKEYS